MLGTRSKRNFSELSSGLPSDYKEISSKKAKILYARLRNDGSKINRFVKYGYGKKSTAYIHNDIFSPKTRKKALVTFKTINGHRANCTFTTPTPISGRHRSAITPNGSELTERIDVGSLVMYLEADKQDTVSESMKKLAVSTLLLEREFRCIVTPEDLIKAGLQKRSSQAKEKGWKAKEAAKASNITMSANQKWHWLHMIAFFMKGKSVQNSGNLFAGTDYANYRHLFLELEVPYLLQYFPNGLTIFGTVLADVNDVAKTFTYNIATDDFELKFQIDAQSLVQPSATEGEYIHNFVKVVLERKEEEEITSFADRMKR